MKKLLISFVGGTVAFSVHAQVLFTYEFPGPDPAGDATAPTPAHLEVSPFARANVSAASQADVFASSHWTKGAAQDPAEFVSFSFRPVMGFSLEFDSLFWDTSRTSTGPQTGRVALYRNGLDVESSPPFAIDTAMGNRIFDFANVTAAPSDSLELRFFGWNASGTGNLRLDNVSVHGSVKAVPEPSSAGSMLGAGVAFLGFRVLRRTRSSPTSAE